MFLRRKQDIINYYVKIIYINWDYVIVILNFMKGGIVQYYVIKVSGKKELRGY